MRDECIGIPPRFHCEYCPSKFRRKYHLVRHLSSKHGIPNDLKSKTMTPTQLAEFNNGLPTSGNASQRSLTPHTYKQFSDTDNENIGENIMPIITSVHSLPPTSATDRFSVEALMMKQEQPDVPCVPIDFSYHHHPNNSSTNTTPTSEESDTKMQTDALQQTFQNLKYLFVNYAMNNVPNFST